VFAFNHFNSVCFVIFNVCCNVYIYLCCPLWRNKRWLSCLRGRRRWSNTIVVWWRLQLQELPRSTVSRISCSICDVVVTPCSRNQWKQCELSSRRGPPKTIAFRVRKVEIAIFQQQKEITTFVIFVDRNLLWLVVQYPYRDSHDV